ncbi:MAG: extracellular solute-binding protein [Actinomycetota bacterium]
MHRTTMRHVLVSVLALAVVCVSSASAGSAGEAATAQKKPTKKQLKAVGAKLVADARRAGDIHFYTSTDPVTAQKLADAFEKNYKIHATFTRAVSGPLAARYNAEAQAGNFVADAVIISNPPFFADAFQRGWTVRMRTWQDAPSLYTLAKKFKFYGSVGVGISRVNGVVINTNRLTGSSVPNTWQALTNSRFEGRMIIGDPRTVPVNMGIWQLLRKTYGDNFLRSIAAQRPRVVASMVGGVQSVAAGEADVAVGANILHMTPLLSSAPNAPVRLITPQGPDFGFTWNVGVSARSPNPAGGKLFVNWLLTPQGQRIFNEQGGVSVLPNVTIAGSEPIGDRYNTVSSNVSPANQAQILSLLGLSR